MTLHAEPARRNSGRAILDSKLCQELRDLLVEAVPGTSDGNSTPLIAPVLLMNGPDFGFRDLISISSDFVTIHEYQYFKVIHPLSAGSEYRLATQIDCEQSRGSTFGFSSEIRDAENQICMRTQTTLRNLNRKKLFRLVSVPMPERQRSEISSWLQSIPLTQEIVNQYLELSSDTNPVHNNPEFTASIGLSGALVPGMLVAGIVELAIENYCQVSAICELRLRFMAPATVGSIVRFGVLDRGQTTIPGQRRARSFAIGPDDTILFIADVLFSNSKNQTQG
jgi:acyl dehydratase